MGLSLKARQVAGVTLIVGLSVVVLSALQVAHVSRVLLEESGSRAQLLANTVFHQAMAVARPDSPEASLREDVGIASILQSGMAYSQNVTAVAIVDARGRVIAHSSPVLEGELVDELPLIDDLVSAGVVEQMRAIYSPRSFEVRERLLMAGEEFGTIRVAVSMALVRLELERALAPAAATAIVTLVVAMLVALAFAQWLLRPIHVLRSGLSRLGRGEFDVRLDLPPDREFAALGRSFDSVSEALASVQTRLAGQSAQFESVVDRLEDAVAMVGPAGEWLFVNRAMRTLLGDAVPEEVPGGGLPASGLSRHPLGGLIDQARSGRVSAGPSVLRIDNAAGEAAEWLAVAHPVDGRDGGFLGVMVSARDLGYLSEVQSTLTYSQKLASLNRLLAGVAHEVKNPLNAMTIHLELLRQKLARPDPEGAGRHVGVIAAEISRLDTVVQGLLKFSRPEELDVRSVDVGVLLDEVATIVGAQAAAAGLDVAVECAPGVPAARGDGAMLKQALLNLALNACEAMAPAGHGRLQLSARGVGRMVELRVDDSGPGIEPEHLGRIFDLYFTTKTGGSGIGLSMVYRAVQLHDGDIEVESTLGRGTTFRVRLPRA